MELNVDITNLVITDIFRKPKRKIYLDITNLCKKIRQKMNTEQTNSDENPLILASQNDAINGTNIAHPGDENCTELREGSPV